MIFIRAEVEGDIRTQRNLAQMDEALQADPEGQALTKGLDWLERETTQYASRITHRWTATLFRSYDAEEGPGLRTIFVSPDVRNPYGQLPANYAAFEFGRGGGHDAFGRAAEHANQAFAPRAAQMIAEEAVRVSTGG